MNIEREILAWVTRVDMFIISAWPWLLAVLALCLAFIAAEIWISRK